MKRRRFREKAPEVDEPPKLTDSSDSENELPKAKKEEETEEEEKAVEEQSEEESKARLEIMQHLVKELQSSIYEKAKKDDVKKVEQDATEASIVVFPSPAKLKKSISVESLGSVSEPEFVKESWTPSPGKKQMTLAASLKKIGSEAQIVKVSSPGAKKAESLKDMLVKQVCNGLKMHSQT